MARPPVERPEGARVDDPIGERPEGARGEEACQLRGRRDVPDQSLSEDREAPPLRGGAPGSRTLGGGGRAPHLRRPRCHGRRLGRTTVLPGEGGAAGTAGRAAGSPAPPRSHLDPKMAITVPAPAGPPRRWNSAGSAGTRPGSAANSLPAANRAGTWGPATGMATRDAGGGGEPPELSVPSRRACPAQCVWLASAGEAAPPGAESRPRAAPPRPSGRRARARGGQ